MASFAVRLQGGAFLSAASNGAYSFGTGDFTLEAWIRPQGAGTILSRKGSVGGQGNGGWLLVLQPDGGLKLATDNGFGYYQAISQARPVLDGQWHHVAAVRAGGAVSVYVDGASVPVTASGTAATPTDVTNSLRLLAGATDQVQEPYIRFTGELDELRVWNLARSAAQIQAWMRQRLSLPQSGLVGYWTFQDRSLADLSATGNAFAAQGTVDFTQPGAPLQPPTYAVQLASSAFLAASSNGAYDFGTGSFTLEAWVRARGAGTILSRKGSSGGQGNGGWLLVLQPSGALKLATDNGFGYYQAVSQARPVVDGQWHHVAAVRSGGTLTLYVDGAAVPVTASGTAVTPTNVANSLRLLAGATDQVQEPYNRLNGDVDELRVWNVARSAQQIAASWNLPLQLPQPGLVGYWTFDAASFADSSPTGNAFAPQGAATLITPGAPLSGAPLAAPTLQQTAYDGAKVTAQWTAVTDPRLTGYTMAVLVDGAQVGSSQTAAGQTSGSVTVQLDPSRAATVQVQAVAGSVVSTWSTAMPVIDGAPAIASVAYDGTSVSASWAAVTGASAYTMTVYDGTTVVATGTASGTQGSVAAALDRTKSYTLVVQGTGSGTTGPQSPATVVIAGMPVIAAVSYDGISVGANWGAVAGAASYTMTVYDGGTVVGTANPTGPQGSVAATLDPAKSYTLQVTAKNGSTTGPTSAAAAIIAAAPTLASVAYDGTSVTASWSAVTGAAGYTLTVYDGTTVIGTANPTETQGSVTATLDPTKTYTVRVRATNGVSSGPESAAVTVIAAASTLASVTYDGTSVTASWSAVTGAAGYTLTVYDGTTVVGSASPTDTQGSVAATLDPAKTYTVRVRATNGASSGPGSEAVTVLTVAPTGMQLDYDGTALVAGWQAVAGAPGYSAELLADGAPVETQPATGTTVSFTQTMVSGVGYTARARVSAPPALGPWSNVATAPYLAAVTYVYDVLGRLRSVAMPAVNLGYTYDDAGNILTATRTLPGGGNSPAETTPDAPTP